MQKSTEQFPKVPQSTKSIKTTQKLLKVQKVPKSTQNGLKAKKIAKNTQFFFNTKKTISIKKCPLVPKILKRTENKSTVPKSIHRYKKVQFFLNFKISKSTPKYIKKVSKSAKTNSKKYSKIPKSRH